MVNGAPFGFDSKIDNEDKGSFIPTAGGVNLALLGEEKMTRKSPKCDETILRCCSSSLW